MNTPYLRFGLSLAFLLTILAFAFAPEQRCGMTDPEDLTPEADLHVQKYGLSADDYLNRPPTELPTFSDCASSDYAERASCSRENLSLYLRANINQRVIAGKRGRVQIAFTVDLGGEVREIKALGSTEPELANEVVRILGKMQGEQLRWTPGKINGTSRAVQLKLNLSFGLRCSDCYGMDEEIAINEVIR